MNTICLDFGQNISDIHINHSINQNRSRNMKQFRQGDVLIERIEALPENLKDYKRDNGRIILAYGEVTGHAHAIDEETAKSFVNEAGELFIEVDEPAEIVHEEHAAIPLPTGVYRITHQREYTPEEIHRVAD